MRPCETAPISSTVRARVAPSTSHSVTDAACSATARSAYMRPMPPAAPVMSTFAPCTVLVIVPSSRTLDGARRARDRPQAPFASPVDAARRRTISAAILVMRSYGTGFAYGKLTESFFDRYGATSASSSPSNPGTG